MPNYPGKRKGTRRIVIWAKLEGDAKSKPHEWIVEGTKADGAVFEARKKVELAQKRNLAPRTAPLFSSFCVERYAPYARRHLKAGTWERRHYQVATLIRHFGRLKMHAIGLVDVERFKEIRIEEGLKAVSINGELSVLRGVLEYADALGVVVPRLKWKRLPERGRGRVRAWTTEQVQALYASARELAPEIVPLLTFLINTGCRKGEAIMAEWSWIDFKANMIRIPTSDVWQPKSDRPREVPMADAVRAVLAGPRLHETWVFPNAWGRRFRDFPHAAFWAARTAAGLAGGVHTTRHTYASHALAAGLPLRTLADVMGHTTTKVTELYAHMMPGHLDAARNAVNIGPSVAVVKKGEKVRSRP